MADFRRWFTVLAVMALFVGLASAQVVTGSSSPLNCGVQNSTVTPTLRAEGFTELTGDILLICTGGSALAVGSPIPTVNITVYYNVTAVTSRLLTSTASGGNTYGTTVNSSEALLLIDEPNGSNLNSEAGYGPSLPQMLCRNIQGTSDFGPANGAGPNGCPQVVGTAIIGGNAFPGVPVVPGTNNPGANVFMGVVNQSTVTFNGIPLLPPASAGASRVLRITNVRVNANGSGGGVAGGPGQVNASISISPAGSLTLQQPNPIVGLITPGLKSSVAGATSFNQCNSTGGAFAGLLNFSENFGTAFKTRVDGARSGLTNNYATTGIQNSPYNGAYNSESNFIANGTNQSSIGGSIGTVSNGTFVAGLADYGTRLKATFLNVPAGATVFVTTNNVISQNNNNVMQAVLNPNSNTTATSYATLISAGTGAGAEATPDSNSVSSVLFTNTFTTTSISSTGGVWNSTPLQYVAMTSQGSPMSAVWEVLNTQPTYQETITFAVYIAYTATATFPPQGSSQVAFSFAANPTSGAISATNAPTGLLNVPIPRFADTSGGPGNPIGTIFNVSLCQTVLLFPYVTTVTGYETGISIANTTTDPFKTTPQQGLCNLFWYNTGAANPPNGQTAIVPSGQIVAFNASNTTNGAGVGFSGYMIAQCYFQLAHGAAVVTDYGAQKIVSVYLALVVPTGPNNRNGYSATSPEALNN